MKILKLSVAFLSLLFLPSGQLYAQADNYEKHKNDDVSQISNREMTFYLVFKSHFDIVIRHWHVMLYMNTVLP